MVYKSKTNDPVKKILSRDLYRNQPYHDPMDPKFRRLMYLRYADDFVILIAGPHSDAVNLKKLVGKFLINECKLRLN